MADMPCLWVVTKVFTLGAAGCTVLRAIRGAFSSTTIELSLFHRFVASFVLPGSPAAGLVDNPILVRNDFWELAFLERRCPKVTYEERRVFKRFARRVGQRIDNAHRQGQFLSHEMNRPDEIRVVRNHDGFLVVPPKSVEKHIDAQVDVRPLLFRFKDAHFLIWRIGEGHRHRVRQKVPIDQFQVRDGS